MANDENLVHNRTTKEARENGKKGGVASGKSRNNKKNMREMFNMMLDMKPSDIDVKAIKAKFPELDEEAITNSTAILMPQMVKALAGETKSFELVRDTSGQKPVEQFEDIGDNYEVDVDGLSEENKD